MIFLELEIGIERVASLRISSLWCFYRNVYSRIVLGSYTRYVSAFTERRPYKKNSRDSIFFFSLSISWFRFLLSFVAMLFVSELTPRNVFIDRLLLFFSSIVSHAFTLPLVEEIFTKWYATCISKSCPCWRYMKRVASEYRIYDLTYIYPLAISWPTKSMDTRSDESNLPSSRSASSSVALTSRNTRALARYL